MKLHLPSRLRKALLACLAVAVPTLASGSTLLAAEVTSPPAVPNEGMGGVPGGQTVFDATRDITVGEDGKWSFGEVGEVSKAKMFFVWTPTSNGQYTLKWFNNESELLQWKMSSGYNGQTYEFAYKNAFDTGIVGIGSQSYGWSSDSGVNAFLQLTDSGSSNITISGGKRVSRLISGFEDNITGAYYGLSGGVKYYKQDSPTQHLGQVSSGIESSSDDSGGGAIHLDASARVNNLHADFIYNKLDSSNPHGGAVYVDYGASVTSLKGSYIGNYMKAAAKGVGGAIFNYGRIDEIDGTFIGNYINAGSTNNPIGGVIANGAESVNMTVFNAAQDGTISSIGGIKGYFVGNYLRNDISGGDVIGATIASYGYIGSVDGVFIGNYSYADRTANSGVLRNYSRDKSPDDRVAVIGASNADWKEAQDRDAQLPEAERHQVQDLLSKTVMSGIFIGNYAQGVNGDGYGGVMRNNGEIRGAIEGIFVGNYATTIGKEVTNSSSPEVGNYDYINMTGQTPRQNRAMAYGGALYNEVKIIGADGSGIKNTVAMGDVRGQFYDNYVDSTYGEAFGGAIYNQDASIQNIKGVFDGNHAVSSYYVARGGAIYDNSEAEGYDALIGRIGAEGDLSTFYINFAKGKMSQGGSIFVSSGATVENVYANFTGNYALSEVKDDETWYYTNNVQRRTTHEKVKDSLLVELHRDGLHPTAQGGALYVADNAKAKNITGSFNMNYARTTGVGYSSVAQTNVYHHAHGGAIYVAADGATESIKGNFTGNYVETLGLIHVENIAAEARGGAIYVNAGTIQKVVGDFTSNEAATYSLGDNTQDVQGGAIYLDEYGTVSTITGNFRENRAISADLTARDGDSRGDVGSYYDDKNGTRAPDSIATTVTVQGGAMFVAGSAHAADVNGSFTENTAVSQASDNRSETVQGGAIYVADSGYIGNIGAYNEKATKAEDLGFVSITSNSLVAEGHGSELTKQEVQGGAIYVSEAGAGNYSIKNIYAGEIKGNTITVKADGDEKNSGLSTRVAQGGAIYLANKGVMKNIGAHDWVSSITKNTITVQGGHEDNLTALTAQGGAIFANDGAHSNNIYASFTENSIDTSEATGNTSETLAGGAIYLAKNAYIGSIGSSDAWVSISSNKLNAGGLGAYMTAQTVQGGAIYVSEAGAEGYSIQNIYAGEIKGNEITASAGTGSLNNRTVQGGAIYLSDGGVILDIGQKVDNQHTLITENKIKVTGGSGANNTALTAQGGAIFADANAHSDNIYASFTENSIDTSKATGNASETLAGGAIYLAKNAYIGNIGSEESLVTIKSNSLKAGGLGENMTAQTVQGGAIYVSEAGADGYSIKKIYAAEIMGNTIEAAVGDSDKLGERTIQGGAIYLFRSADVDDIGLEGKVSTISKNSITVTGGNEKNATKLTTGGGAIFAGFNASVGNVYASFVENGITTESAEGNQTETLQGGAVYLSGGAKIGTIGSGDAAVQVRGNYLKAGGLGEGLTEQTVQGGAFYLGMDLDTKEAGTMRSVYADFVGNKITASIGTTNQWEGRNIQGGALYLADGSVIDSITQAGDIATQVEQPQMSTKQLAKLLMDRILNPVTAPSAEQEEVKHGFVGNGITVTGGKDSEAEEATLVAQGGALYASTGAKVTGSVIMNFVDNAIDTTLASGSAVERVAGGAIYLAAGASIGDLGSSTDRLQIKNNTLQAGGRGTKLTTQWARGGAIYVGSELVGEELVPGSMKDIYADITDNSISISADNEGNAVLSERYAKGGALYVADGGNIGSITQSLNGEGITRNTITVTGGNAVNSTKLEAMGGAFYLQDGATAKGVMASFTYNGISTSDATGNGSETVGGGAIYLAKKSALDAIGEVNDPVTIAHNYLTAGGKGDHLTEQTVQGGAIYVSSQPDDKKTPSIGAINADIINNSIAAGVGDSKTVKTRLIQGGAIYLDENGAIRSITQKDSGIVNNTITVTGGASEEATLTVQGGAIFVSTNSNIDGIEADFSENVIQNDGTKNASSLAQGGAIYVAGGGMITGINGEFTSNAIDSSTQVVGAGNGSSLAQGGAIYVAGGGEVGDIGILTELVTFESNHVHIGKNAVKGGKDAENMANKYAMGGAIYLAKDAEGWGKLGHVYAEFTGNYALLEEGSSNYVDARAYGGAVFVSEESQIGDITGDFKQNYAESREQNGVGSHEMVHGGAIDVAFKGKAGVITGSFIGNYVKNSGKDVSGDITDTSYAENMHAKGGAIYLAEQGTIDVIGSAVSMFEENYAQGSGQVRGGAILVTNAYVGEIAGTFYKNYADGTESLATFGGAIRFDDSMLVRLESNFYNNHTTGTGGALSLTEKGVIYEVTGDFKGNYAALNGGGVEVLGAIGLRGYAELDEGDAPRDDYGNVTRKEGSHELLTTRDSTDTRLGSDYLNKENRNEYDGSFTGGFVNSNFLYNTVKAETTTGTLTRNYLKDSDIASQYYRGAGIYTNRDLFITANRMQEVIMSGNKIVKEDGTKIRSAIYVDNKNPEFADDDYQSLIVYLVAKNDAVLRIDDNIRGHEESTSGLVVRLRGYTDTHYTTNPYDTTGLIILNNRVERTYTVMDDVTLYIGYKPRTYNDTDYFAGYGKDLLEYTKDCLVGDETDENIIMGGKVSEYLNVAGTASRDGNVINRASKGTEKGQALEFHQSDVFRDSFVSVRSGTVALTENTYSKHDGVTEPRFGDMKNTREVYTEYLFGGLIAYGADYNYGAYGTNAESVTAVYTGSSMATAGKYGSQQYPYRWGSKDAGRYATFEFGISFAEEGLYDLALANRYYYEDMNGNPTEKSFWVDESGATHPYNRYKVNGKDVHVVHRMAKSDMLTVFAVWDGNDLAWENDEVARGRVTLNGLTISSVMDDETAWLLTNKSVSGQQTDANLAKDKDSDVLEGDGFNRDLYVQLINYMLVDSKGELVKGDALQKFYAMFDDPEEEGNLKNGYHLLRLSDHFDLIHNASWAMKGSDILADEIELATTVTKDDSLHVVNWRDHLAEWAEHQASWDGETMTTVVDDDGNEVMEPLETAGLYTGKKHFLLDQSVYYLNRNINIEANPTESHYAPVDAQMWGQYLTIEGVAKNKELNLQGLNMLSWIIPDQQVRLQSFTLTEVKEDARVGGGLIQNDGDLILDTMKMEKSLTINNAGNSYEGTNPNLGQSYTLDNRLTVTGVMDIDFTITTIDSEKTGKHGNLVINHSTEVINRALPGWVDPEPETPTTPDPDTDITDPTPDAPGLDPDIPETELDPTLPDPGDLTPETGGGLAGGDMPSGAAVDGTSILDDSIPGDTVTDGNASTGSEPVSKGDSVLSESIVHITGVVEHQDVTHQGEDELVLGNEELTYKDADEEQKLGTWSILTGNRDYQTDVRETFTSNTYLDTTEKDGKTATKQFLAFKDNSLTMEGGAFNLGIMYKHRLPLRYFRVNGGSVFVDHSTINLKEERMGGIDAKDGDALFAGDSEATRGKNTSGTGDGLIWLQEFVIEDTSEKTLVHVKFVDDGVGNAVKDGMGIANGAQKSNMRLMRDGKRKYIWQVTYNDARAENDYEDFYKGKTGVKGMYTFYRLGFTPEAEEGPVADLTGSYVTMMQVYNYSFQHADLYSTNMAAAREQQLYADHYSVVDVKGKGSLAPVHDSCPPSSAGLRSGLWLHTYSSTETMPLRNGPEVRLNMYGGLVGGDSALKEHRNGWGSVWSLYGGYVGSTQKYDDVRIRQSGGAFGLTGTFYKKKFYTALTASVGVASATTNSIDCKDDFDLIMGGIASRSGYSFEFGSGRYVLQPNVMLSYTMFNTCDYTNAYGSRVTAKPTGLLQINPFLKFMKNTDCSWKPYAKLGMVYNALGETKYTFDGSSLPSMSIKPYVEYSIGAQRTLRDRYTLYGEATGRNGGRNGAEASAGVRVAW